MRDRSLFVGDPEDVVPHGLGPGLPSIREWTDATFDYCGYVTGFDPVADPDRAGVRAELGYRDDEQVCLVTVGGSGVGLDLLRRIVAAYPQARSQVPGLRMVVVTGPRIDPAQLTRRCRPTSRATWGAGSRSARTCTTCGGTWRSATSPSCRAASPRRWSSPRTGGRSSTSRCGTTSSSSSTYGTASTGTAPGGWSTTTPPRPEELAGAMAAEIGRTVDYVPVPADGADRVAARLADLV